MKTIAMYLPQFHQIPENDEWWGEGYTEWTAVRNARPLYEGHYQPHEPLDDNYYNLLDKQTMLWQAELMKSYHVDALCFYHYYFNNKQMLLEKPAENLLKWKDINMPFCFAWANESWIRTWSTIRGNSWNSTLETGKESSKDNGILIAQEYGGEKEWKAHIDYLIPFFKDDRYLKIEGRPVFVFYRPEIIQCLSSMINYWNSELETIGVKPIYSIGVNSSQDCLDSNLLHQPAYSGRYTGKRRKNYSDICDNIIADSINADNKTFLGGFVAFDNTPRMGTDGIVITNSEPEIFYQQMRKIFYLSDIKHKDFVFVNAWNEWGEGMHLEPDKKNGCAYLNALKKAKEDYSSMEDLDWYYHPKNVVDNNSLDDEVDLLEKYRGHYKLLSKWMSIKENEGDLLPFFSDNGIKKVSIYGMGLLGKHLYSELKKLGIDIECGIDRGLVSVDDLVIKPDSSGISERTFVIVTPIDEYEAIRDNLKNNGNNNVVSLEEVIDYCYIKAQ